MKESKKSKFNIKIPILKLRYRLLLYTAAVLFSLLSLISVNEDKFPYIMEMILYVLAAGTLFPSFCCRQQCFLLLETGRRQRK